MINLIWCDAVAVNSGGSRRLPPVSPPKAQNILNFMQFSLENLVKWYVGAPFQGGLTPSPGEILDPLLVTVFFSFKMFLLRLIHVFILMPCFKVTGD